MERSPLSIKWLEAFQAIARYGSVQDGARGLGVSVSTASHHLSCLEDALGAHLVDHARRPMRLTMAGETLLRRVDEAMWQLRMGASDIWSEDPGALVRLLRIAQIEDFDTDVGPAIIQHLIERMPLCDFSMLSRPSHEVLGLLESEQVDIGIATSMDHDQTGLIEDPVLVDPFLLIIPSESEDTTPGFAELLAQQSELPFLRYSRQQQIGRRIEAQLRRLNMRFAHRMEFESTHAILAMVAAGHGWTITTALNLARAQRYQSGVRALPLPGPSFSRTISVMCREDLPVSLRHLVQTTARGAVQHLVIAPTVVRYPWLTDRMRLLFDVAPAVSADLSHGL